MPRPPATEVSSGEAGDHIINGGKSSRTSAGNSSIEPPPERYDESNATERARLETTDERRPGGDSARVDIETANDHRPHVPPEPRRYGGALPTNAGPPHRTSRYTVSLLPISSARLAMHDVLGE